MNLKNLLLNKKVYDHIKSWPTGVKWMVGGLGFMLTTNIISSSYSKVYNSMHFDSMHSGREDNMSYYSNLKTTDFGSKWKGLSNNILKLIGAKNTGMSDVIKTSMTAFNSDGVDLGKTIINLNKNTIKRHNFISLREKNLNPVLSLHKQRNIGHIVG